MREEEDGGQLRWRWRWWSRASEERGPHLAGRPGRGWRPGGVDREGQREELSRGSARRGDGRATDGVRVGQEDGVDFAQAVSGPVLYCARVERLAALWGAASGG